jgi:hypothetical protein
VKAIAALNIVIGAFLATGGFNELAVRGIAHGEIVAGVIGLIGAVVSLFLAYTGILLWRRERNARRSAVVAVTVSAAFHLLAALLPPHYAGIMVMVLSVAYALVVVLVL